MQLLFLFEINMSCLYFFFLFETFVCNLYALITIFLSIFIFLNRFVCKLNAKTCLFLPFVIYMPKVLLLNILCILNCASFPVCNLYALIMLLVVVIICIPCGDGLFTLMVILFYLWWLFLDFRRFNNVVVKSCFFWFFLL